MNNRNSTLSRFKKLIAYLMPILSIGLAFIVTKYFFQLAMIQGKSMEPNYHNGQIVIVDKRNVEEYQPGDVIVFYCDELGCQLIKRVDEVCQVEETGELCYYVLGDNRDESVDSRDERVGLVNTEQVLGKVVFPDR